MNSMNGLVGGFQAVALTFYGSWVEMVFFTGVQQGQPPTHPSPCDDPNPAGFADAPKALSSLEEGGGHNAQKSKSKAFRGKIVAGIRKMKSKRNWKGLPGPFLQILLKNAKRMNFNDLSPIHGFVLCFHILLPELESRSICWCRFAWWRRYFETVTINLFKKYVWTASCMCV